MKLKEIYEQTSKLQKSRPYSTNMPAISFEIFPPRGDGDEYQTRVDGLFNELNQLKNFDPAFVSVTYGAGGSTQEKTFDIVKKLKNELGIIPMPHFTCVGANQDEIKDYIKKVENAGIQNILALRGDPPKGEKEFKKPENGFGFANELVVFIKEHTDLSIAVAGYPEKHPQAPTIEEDVENLKRKVDAGSEAIITQVFFDNSFFFNFMTRAERAGINIPIIPGIMPITSLGQIEKITSLCASTIPESLLNRLNKYKDDPKGVQELGIEFAIYQTNQLIDFGVKGVHFYPLNKAYAVKEVLENLNIGAVL